MALSVEYIFKKNRVCAGDVLHFRYFVYGLLFSFVGIVIALRNKFFFSESYLILRNVMSKVAVEISVPVIMIDTWELRGYSKKAFKYTKSKLFYLRSKKNTQSIVDPA